VTRAPSRETVAVQCSAMTERSPGPRGLLESLKVMVTESLGNQGGRVRGNSGSQRSADQPTEACMHHTLADQNPCLPCSPCDDILSVPYSSKYIG
jgi:hypothetical protein